MRRYFSSVVMGALAHLGKSFCKISKIADLKNHRSQKSQISKIAGLKNRKCRIKASGANLQIPYLNYRFLAQLSKVDECFYILVPKIQVGLPADSKNRKSRIKRLKDMSCIRKRHDSKKQLDISYRK